MQHDNLEHQRVPPKPFTVRGTLGVVLYNFGMPADTTAEAMEQAFLDGREFMHSGIPCAVVKWECHVEHDGLRVYTVDAMPVRFVTPKAEARHDPQIAADYPNVDPWVTVGTTAVDGTLPELAEAFNVPACAVGASVAGLVEGGHVVEVRGRNLRPLEWVNLGNGCGLVHCDVVRRKSEVDADAPLGKADGECRSCGMFDCMSTHGTCARCCDRAENPCPECGPHGNAGRVLLLESWVDCTTCRPRPTHLVVDGGEGAPLVIDLEKNAIQVHRIRSLKPDPLAKRTQVYFASGRSETFDIPLGANRIDIDDTAETVKFGVAGLAYPTADDVRSSLSASLLDRFSLRDQSAPHEPVVVTIDGQEVMYPPGEWLDGQVWLDDGQTVATFVNGREVSRRGRF